MPRSRCTCARTLDEELVGAGLPDPLLLKIDVQGYERWVLDGGPSTLARAEWVVLELSFEALYTGEPPFLEVVNYMSTHGLRFVRPVGWFSDGSTGEILQCDALFSRAGRGAP